MKQGILWFPNAEVWTSEQKIRQRGRHFEDQTRLRSCEVT